jgi:hypothetical protein
VRTPSIANGQKTHQNRIATLTVTGPSTTDLDIERIPLFNPGGRVLLNQADSTLPGRPGEISSMREVGVVAQDDGTTKTWTIDVNMSACSEHHQLEIFNRARGTRSAPLKIALLRDGSDTECGSWSGGLWLASSGKPGPGDPVNPKPTGPCAGGGSERVFDVCENCSTNHPPDMNTYTGFSACSWSDVLAVFGYTGPAAVKPQICTIREASRQSCEGA